ncbi:sigma-54 dependent transcriptional regulator [Dechloromonas sp. HYN0024]|uniref:sigma-54-dependent transcriptional regulator n=1 Tax=Dechloromonas sp. HYN0024 TaxID=2231055 RepID=UPI000E437175|nr:sigma-54 dependent transcriptional regulator [Dechloromonas sp. HYN0024]AXS81543.1 sigma-54-dependent Fis family transcriptional regulator [Dechloromonas sp. HYN0024]
MPPNRPLLLIVDDDSLVSESLSFAFAQEYDVITSHARAHALTLLRQLRQAPQLALVDLGLPPLPHRPDEGFALISDLLTLSPDMKIIVLSGQSDESNARHARTLGAIDFVAKPCDPSHLSKLLGQAQRFGKETPDTRAGGLIGESLSMQRLRLQLGQYANLPYPVLIEGESGSGKDIVASHYLHRQTERRDQPYLALNCAAISPTLLEPTLFGYAKGAFTGATSAKSGYFEDADHGTLFLDEIGELPLDLQPKLLRVLENGEYQRVGETQTRVSTARIVAATNRDLRQEIKAGRFRADLFHRLSVFTVAVPPLRDTGLDRLLLLEHFRKGYAASVRAEPFELAAPAQSLWLDYAFPGNVRELRNIVIRLSARYPGQTVSASQLRDELDQPDTIEPATSTAGLIADDLDVVKRAARQHLERSSPINLDATLELWQRGYIEAAIELSAGNMSEAARRLGINRTTLYNRMEIWTRR